MNIPEAHPVWSAGHHDGLSGREARTYWDFEDKSEWGAYARGYAIGALKRIGIPGDAPSENRGGSLAHSLCGSAQSAVEEIQEFRNEREKHRIHREEARARAEAAREELEQIRGRIRAMRP